MKNGNISNRHGKVIAVRVEDCILKPPDNTIWSMGKFLDPLYKYELDENVRVILTQLNSKTDYSIHLISDPKHADNVLVREVIDTYPHNGVSWVLDTKPISIRLMGKVYEYYVDNNLERISRIGVKYAITFKELCALLGK